MRRCLFLLVLTSPVFWPATPICPTPLARGDGNPSKRVAEWRRTELGWEDATCWRRDTTPARFPAAAAAIHPLVIASLELMISVGALVAGTPTSLEERC